MSKLTLRIKTQMELGRRLAMFTAQCAEPSSCHLTLSSSCCEGLGSLLSLRRVLGETASRDGNWGKSCGGRTYWRGSSAGRGLSSSVTFLPPPSPSPSPSPSSAPGAEGDNKGAGATFPFALTLDLAEGRRICCALRSRAARASCASLASASRALTISSAAPRGRRTRPSGESAVDVRGSGMGGPKR